VSEIASFACLSVCLPAFLLSSSCSLFFFFLFFSQNAFAAGIVRVLARKCSQCRPAAGIWFWGAGKRSSGGKKLLWDLL
jgi:hypothetical protein